LFIYIILISIKKVPKNIKKYLIYIGGFVAKGVFLRCTIFKYYINVGRHVVYNGYLIRL